MRKRTLLARIERVEQLAKVKTKFSPGCVCFPDKEPPFFGFSIEEAIAAKVTCPIHGKRTYLRFLRLYLPAWRRENEKIQRSRLSPQYQKAWNASFPPHLWPAEEVLVHSELMLRLKDGTLIATGERVGV
jgi:hypothetical protein